MDSVQKRLDTTSYLTVARIRKERNEIKLVPEIEGKTNSWMRVDDTGFRNLKFRSFKKTMKKKKTN
jgi:hypothetical protein